MEVRKEFEYSPLNCWSQSNPYTLAFVYPKDDTPYVVKGGLRDVEAYLKSNEPKPAIIHYTHFHGKTHRRIIETINCGKVLILRKGSTTFNWVWEIQVADYGIGPYKVIAKIRKLPRKWIKELDPYVSTGKKEVKDFRRIVL